ncbi:Long chronological lifespan protein 2 [Bienertia sinuspersici]
MLIAWIVNTLDISEHSKVRFPDHVKTLWDDLRDRYSLGNGPRILELKSRWPFILVNYENCKMNWLVIANFPRELVTLLLSMPNFMKVNFCINFILV